MTEEQIEREAEKAMDSLDRRFMRGEFTQEEYDDEVRDLDKWTRDQTAASKWTWLKR